MQKKIFFGTAGIPHSSNARDSVSGIERVKELGLDAMELEFVRGVHLGKEAAEKVNEKRKCESIELTVHAPYYVNLNSLEKEKRVASRKRILDSARAGFFAGAKSVVFHAAYYHGMQSEKVLETVEVELGKIVDSMKQEKIKVSLAIETTGKKSQFGTIEETLELSKRIDAVKPCIDFAHLYARCNGCLKEKKDFEDQLQIIESFGKHFFKNLHMHASGMNFSEKGERNHLNFDDAYNKFDYKKMLQALKQFNVSGILICESPNLETDALKMKKYYEKLG